MSTHGDLGDGENVNLKPAFEIILVRLESCSELTLYFSLLEIIEFSKLL